MGLRQRISHVCELLAIEVFCSRKETDRAYASRFIDRVLFYIKNEGEEGCTESSLIRSFNLGEADLVDHTLRELYKHGVLKKEVRYFIRK